MSKTIKFRPLRVIKKTGKITVASYMQWRRIKTADYNKFTLIIDESYKLLADDEFVYNHEGEQLFFYDLKPDDIKIFVWNKIQGIDSQIQGEKNYAIDWGSGSNLNYNCRGLDCDGVPVFSHKDTHAVSQSSWEYIMQFEPLTVGVVKMWFGWFLYQLENSVLK